MATEVNAESSANTGARKTWGVYVPGLQRARMRAGLTQRELAASLDGFPNAMRISHWESGHRKIDSRRLPALAEALGTTVEDLLEADDG